MSDQDKYSTHQKSASSETMPSTSKSVSNMTRIQRNVAEKQRRDKLNGYISELANIVPMVSMSSKRLDKTSILRLSAAHLRLSKSPLSGNKKLKKSFAWCPSFLTAQQAREILESVDGFLIVTSSSGKILFTSGSVERYLGHQNIDMIGHPLFVFIHPDDTESVKEELDSLLTASLKCGDSDPAPRRSFYCRMREKGQPRSEVATYQCVHFSGDMTICDDENGSNGSPKNSAVITHIFKAFVRVVDENPYSQLSLEDACADEYVTRHSLDGTIIFADHRLSTITGHLPQEVIGKSAYKFILPEDSAIALFAHHLMFSSDKGTGMIVYRLRTSDEKYVYLKSVGSLQYDQSTSQVDHFVCVNQYLSDAEGEVQLKYFVDRFVPHIRDSSVVTLLESVKTLQVVGLESPVAVNSIKEIFSALDVSKLKEPHISINGNVLNNQLSKNVTDISSATSKSSKLAVHFSESSSKSATKRQTPSPQEIMAEKIDNSQECSSPLSQDLQNKVVSKKRRACSSILQNSASFDDKSTKCNSALSTSSNSTVLLMMPKVLQVKEETCLNAPDGLLIPSQSSSMKKDKRPVNGDVHVLNYITDYQNSPKLTDSQTLENSVSEQMNMLQGAVSDDVEDSSFQVSQANAGMSSVFTHSPSKTEEVIKVCVQSDLPSTYALSSESLMNMKTNILLSSGTVLYSNELQMEALKANFDSCELLPVQNSSFTNSVKHSDSSQIPSNVNDVILETSLWPTETSSESSTLNHVSEETLSTSVESSGDNNLYFLPGDEMKDYLSSSDYISPVFHSTVPLDDSSLPSVDGWNERFRPGNVLNSQNIEVGMQVDGEQSLVKIYAEKSFESR